MRWRRDTLLIVLCLLGQARPAAADWQQAVQHAAALHLDGCARSARYELEQVLNGRIPSGSSRELIDLQELILEGCTDAFDVECMVR